MSSTAVVRSNSTTVEDAKVAFANTFLNTKSDEAAMHFPWISYSSSFLPFYIRPNVKSSAAM